jgi:hypothetical protein
MDWLRGPTPSLRRVMPDIDTAGDVLEDAEVEAGRIWCHWPVLSLKNDFHKGIILE